MSPPAPATMTASSNADANSSPAVSAPPPPRGPALGRPPRLVWLLTALHAVLLVFHGVLVPTWRAGDEPNHVDLVVAVAEEAGYPAYDQRVMDPGIRGSLPLVQFEEGSRHLTRREAVPRAERPARTELREAGRDVDLSVIFDRDGVLNHMAQHPPAYYLYVAAGTVVTDALVPGTGLGSYDREVGIMRVLSLLLVVPLPLLAWATATAAGASVPTAAGAAVVPLAIPQLTHIGAGVNNDALLLLMMGTLTLLAVRFAAGHVDRRGVVLAGALTGVALLVKAFAFIVPVWLAVALAFGLHRRGGRWAPVMGGYLAVAFVVGGWWWLVNLVRYGSISPSVEYANRLREAASGVERNLSGWLSAWVPQMSERFWGSFGWMEVPLQRPWTAAATAVVIVTVAAAAVGRGRLPGTVTVVLVLPTLLLAAFVFLSGFRLYWFSAVPAMVQGRYLFGGLVGLSVLVAIGLGRLLGRRAGLVPAVLLLAAAAMQLRAVATLLGTFWGEPGSSIVHSLAAAAAWSPWPPAALLALGAVGVATVVATGIGALPFAGLGRRRSAD